MKKCLIFAVLSIIIFSTSFGQSESNLKGISTEVNKQKTANSKDIFTSLYTAGIDNLLGNNHTFSFSSSFFGIDSIFRKKGTTLPYERERRMRQKSFNVGITGDSNNNIKKLSGGFTLTILNKKDITKKFDAGDTKKLVSVSVFVSELKTNIFNYITQNYIINKYSQGSADSIRKLINTSWNQADRKHDFSKVHPYIQEALSSPALESDMTNTSTINTIYTQTEIIDMITLYFQGKDMLHMVYVEIAEKYARKPLWTFTPDFTYNKTDKQAGYSFASAFTVGLGKDITKKPWEFEIKSLFKIENDTSEKKINYDSKPFNVSVGVNKVLLQNEEKESKMEFKFFSQYDYQFGKVGAGKDAGLFSLNTTFRINVFKSLWLPITLKYDPKNSNFLGFFAVTANLGN
jgi:hypothetical protein